MLLAIMRCTGMPATTDIPTLMHTAAAVVADLGVAGVFCLVCVKMPMGRCTPAPGRARRGATRLGDPGGDPVEDGGYGFLRFSLPMFPLASTNRRS